jgi:FkbM family methyltransferase
MNIGRFFGKCLSAYYIIRSKAQPGYSQAGEDLLVRYLFNSLRIPRPTYLDIGTNHPIIGNNTYYFYLRGSRGVCVEPDPGYSALIKKHRRRDVILQTGIGGERNSGMDLYIFPHPYTGWNTFSAGEAFSRKEETGIGFKEIQQVPLETINWVIEKYFDPYPNFLSIDVEGMDLSILHSLDFARFRPEVICVETITFSTHNEEVKVNEITDFLLSKGYFVFGDTHINTVFCRKDAYKNTPV